MEVSSKMVINGLKWLKNMVKNGLEKKKRWSRA
jgi:hypothetical protein